MPEGPEVTFIANYIERKYRNSTLKSVEIVRGRYKNHGPPKDFDNFSRDLPLKLIHAEKKGKVIFLNFEGGWCCLLYTSPSPRDRQKSRMPSSA